MSRAIPLLADLAHDQFNVTIAMLLDKNLLLVSSNIDSKAETIHNDKLDGVINGLRNVFEER